MIKAQMRHIEGVRFPVSVLVPEHQSNGFPSETFDLITGGVIRKVYERSHTPALGLFGRTALVVDPYNGNSIFVRGYEDVADEIVRMGAGTIVHAIGSYACKTNGTQTFRVVEFLSEAPIIENGRFASFGGSVRREEDLEPAPALAGESLQ